MWRVVDEQHVAASTCAKLHACTCSSCAKLSCRGIGHFSCDIMSEHLYSLQLLNTCSMCFRAFDSRALAPPVLLLP
jgi:hypothetical protein